MRNILLIMIAGLVPGCFAQSNGQSYPSKIEATKIDSTFNYHLNRISHYLRNGSNETAIPIAVSVGYLERVTAIPSSGDWTYFGNMGLRIEDVYEWRQWYAENRQLLVWDVKTKAIQVHREKSDREKYLQASEYIISQKNLWANSSLSLSDSLVYIPVLIFYDALKEENQYNRSHSMKDSLRSLNAKRTFKPVPWDKLDNSKFNPSSDMIVYFSKVYSNQLAAKVVDRKEGANPKYDITFLFEFDRDNEIRKVYFVK
jgi:hypothetical protein